MKKITFYLALATLITHEMDAMLNHEWRVLPLTSWLPEDAARLVFTLAHIPIFAVLIALIASPKAGTRLWTRIGISLFLVFHAVLHLLFSSGPAYEFSSVISQLLIYGGAGLGLVYLGFELLERQRQKRPDG